MRSFALLSATLTTVGVLSAACGYGSGDVEAGDCFRTGTAAAFGWGTEVPCDQPHSVEVIAVRDVTGTFGETPRGALEEGNPARRQYLALMADFCEPTWSDYTGFGDLGGSLTPDAVVLPAIYGDMALEASLAEDWDAGNKTVICYQVLGRPGADGAEAVSVDRPVLAALGQAPAAVPPQVRDCWATTRLGAGPMRVLTTRPALPGPRCRSLALLSGSVTGHSRCRADVRRARYRGSWAGPGPRVVGGWGLGVIP